MALLSLLSSSLVHGADNPDNNFQVRIAETIGKPDPSKPLSVIFQAQGVRLPIDAPERQAISFRSKEAPWGTFEVMQDDKLVGMGFQPEGKEAVVDLQSTALALLWREALTANHSIAWQRSGSASEFMLRYPEVQAYVRAFKNSSDHLQERAAQIRSTLAPRVAMAVTVIARPIHAFDAQGYELAVGFDLLFATGPVRCKPGEPVTGKNLLNSLVRKGLITRETRGLWEHLDTLALSFEPDHDGWRPSHQALLEQELQCPDLPPGSYRVSLIAPQLKIKGQSSIWFIEPQD